MWRIHILKYFNKTNVNIFKERRFIMGLIDAKWKGASLKQDASNRLVTDSEKNYME